MTNISMNRRQLLAAGASLASVSLLGVNRSFAADATNMRMVWWGSEHRAQITNKAIDMFKSEHSGLSIAAETMGWDDYWTRLATQVAGGNAPDVIQMDYSYLFEYARRGALLPLDAYLGKELKIEDFGKENLASCSVDGKLYGANVGVNAFGSILDAGAWREAEVEPPTYGTTYEQYAEKCAAFAKGNKRKQFYASPDGSVSVILFEGWLRAMGLSLYDEEGGLGFEPADVAKWYKYWGEMRAAKTCVPAEIQALNKLTIETSTLTLGYSAVEFGHSNQFVGYQQLNKAELSLTGQPIIAGGGAPHFLKPSQMFTIYSKSKHPEMAASLISFLVGDPRGASILGIERGVPASAEIRDKLMPTLDATSQKVVKFISDVQPYVGALPPAPPRGAGEIANVFTRVGQEVAFDASSPEDGAEALVSEAKSILARG